MRDDCQDFTTENYRRLIALAKERFRFRFFPEFGAGSGNVLWRHDVDFSPHRALRLARIESEAGVRTTYFWHLQSSFYNVFEPAVTQIVLDVAALGHAVGLHFDTGNRSCSDVRSLEEALLLDRKILEGLSGHEVRVVSFHNPTIIGIPIPREESVAGMVNAYADVIKERYSYCSDSNGCWRFRRLEDVLLDETVDDLQVLTHPAWWTESPMPPHDRIWRCVDGRCSSVKAHYLSLLAKSGRRDVQ